MESQSLEQLAESLFDEMGYKEGDELTFDTNAARPNADDSQPKALGEQSEKGKEPETKAEQKQPERLYAGKYKTPEEMEAALIGIEKQAQPQRKEEQPQRLPDLTSEELITLHEQDDQDGKDFTVQYLKKKMLERNLTDFEVETLKGLDNAKIDLYGEYVSARTKREVYAELQPVLKPVHDEQMKKQYDSFIENENVVNSSNKMEFGDELAELEKKISTPDMVAKVLAASPLRQVILNEWDNGSKAMSHKLLLREARVYSQQEQANAIKGKKEKSIPADVTGASKATKTEKAQTLDEAFDESCKELNF